MCGINFINFICLNLLERKGWTGLYETAWGIRYWSKFKARQLAIYDISANQTQSRIT